MKRIAILLLAIGACGEEEEKGGPGLRVWQCDGVPLRGPLDVGLPPAARGTIEFAERATGPCRGWAVVHTSDGETGAISRVDLGTYRVEAGILPANPEAAVRHIDFGTEARLYVLNRFGTETLQVYDTTGTTFVPVGSPIPIGDGTADPQDICCASREQCYVTRLQDPGVLILNPELGEQLGAIDLSALDGDGNPDASACFIGGARLAVALRRLSGGSPQQGMIAFIDLMTSPPMLVSTLETRARNPMGSFRRQDVSIARIAEVGDLGSNDGVLEVIDAANRASGGVLLSEEALGGDLVGFDTCVSNESWALAAGADGVTRLQGLDLPPGEEGSARRAIFEAEDEGLTSIAAPENCARLWVADLGR